MKVFNRLRLLNTIKEHETLTIDDIAKKENLGMVPDARHLGFLLDELSDSGHIKMLNDVIPSTYTITEKGITECERLNNVE